MNSYSVSRKNVAIITAWKLLTRFFRPQSVSTLRNENLRFSSCATRIPLHKHHRVTKKKKQNRTKEMHILNSQFVVLWEWNLFATTTINLVCANWVTIWRNHFTIPTNEDYRSTIANYPLPAYSCMSRTQRTIIIIIIIDGISILIAQMPTGGAFNTSQTENCNHNTNCTQFALILNIFTANKYFSIHTSGTSTYNTSFSPFAVPNGLYIAYYLHSECWSTTTTYIYTHSYRYAFARSALYTQSYFYVFCPNVSIRRYPCICC